jgi:hypothetical protein
MLRNQSLTNSLMALLFLATWGSIDARSQGAPPAPTDLGARSQTSPAKHSYQGPDLNDATLGLSEEQKTKILEIYDAMTLRILEVSRDSSLSQKDKMLRWQQLRDDRQRQIEAVIPADRLTAWREMQKDWKEMREQKARQAASGARTPLGTAYLQGRNTAYLVSVDGNGKQVIVPNSLAGDIQITEQNPYYSAGKLWRSGIFKIVNGQLVVANGSYNRILGAIFWADFSFHGTSDANGNTTTDETDLMMAATDGNQKVVQALLDAGVDVNTKTADGGTALMAASEKGDQQVMRALLEAKADANAKSSNGITPLIIASANGHPEAVRALLDARADVNAKTVHGFTALMAASQYGRQDVVMVLLNAQANVNAMQNDGTTALKWASKNGHKEVVRLLKKAGAAGH